MNEIKDLYSRLNRGLTEHSLKEITTQVLGFYKANNETRLRLYANALYKGDKHGDLPIGKLFLKLVKIIHPDRLTAHRQRLDAALARGDKEELLFFQSLLNLEQEVRIVQRERFAHSFAEEYSWDEEDFGYHTDDVQDPDESCYEEVESDFDFISAIKAEYPGNLEFTMNPADLGALEGELNLSAYGLDETEGLQFCKNINRLNLSDNRISNLYDLQGLFYLEELLLGNNLIDNIEYLRALENLQILDLSFNDVEDISPLLDLPSLEFVDLRGNPVRTLPVLEELMSRGVVIVS